MKREGWGPRTFFIGVLERISLEAERAWQQKMEEQAAQNAAQLEAERRKHMSELAKKGLNSPNHPRNKPRR
jgi:hypothetical protein